MTPQLEDIIRKEAEKRMSIKSVGVENYQAGFEHGSSWMAEHMEKVLEWAARSSYHLNSDDGRWYAFDNVFANSLTTSQLIERYFQHIKSKE